jgi:hypothetical protein
MALILVRTLKSDFEYQSARGCIERNFDEISQRMRRLLLGELGSLNRVARLARAFDNGMLSGRERVLRDLEIASYELRRSKSKKTASTQRRGNTPAPKLPFLKDDDLKQFAATAVHDAIRCFDAEAYTAAAVMAGSATEAVLLDLLLRSRSGSLGKTHEELRKERLGDLINLAARHGILGNSAAKLGHIVREHRDLIHPARAVRERTVLSRGKAEISLGILRDICEELAREKELCDP